jgi:peroxiredoxin
LDKLYRHHKGDANIRFFSVAQEDRDGACSFADSYKLTMPVALDSKPYTVSAQYGLIIVPTLFLIQGDGTVDQVTVGFVKKEFEELAQKLAKASGKEPAPLFKDVSVPDIKPG